MLVVQYTVGLPVVIVEENFADDFFHAVEVGLQSICNYFDKHWILDDDYNNMILLLYTSI